MVYQKYNNSYYLQCSLVPELHFMFGTRLAYIAARFIQVIILSIISYMQFRYTLVLVLLADFVMAYLVDQLLSFFLGTSKLKLPA